MAKIGSLKTVASGFLSTTSLNSNFSAITAAFNNTVSRDGSSPNTMSADFDMNSNFILNLPTPTQNTHAATKKYVDDNSGAAAIASAEAAQAAAEAARDDAQTAQTAAELAETNAETAQTAAEAAAASINLPSSLTGEAGNSIRVNVGETGYEFYTPGGLSDGDKGDITVSSSGTVWNIDAGVVGTTELADASVTLSKLDNIDASAGIKVIGRTTASDGVPQLVDVLDEDTMSSDSATAIPTQQSVKAYVDNNISASSFTTQVFTSSGTYTKPAGLVALEVTVTGAGGGSSPSASSGETTGGTSSFGAHASSTGGGTGSGTIISSGGSASGGDINLPGAQGMDNVGSARGSGASSYWGGAISTTTKSDNTYGAGATSSGTDGTGAGGGATAIKRMAAGDVSSTETVTVGVGGNAGTSGGVGGNGIVIVKEYF